MSRKKEIRLLCAETDRDALKPIVEQLSAKGFTVSDAKDAKKAKADRTIERPARKISMTDGYAEEKAAEQKPAEEQTEPPREDGKEE